MIFSKATAADIRNLNGEQTLVVLPLAASEQHGPHLPTGTDTIICQAVAEAVEAQLADRILLLPSLWLGASDHHLRFGATLTASLDVYETLLLEIVQPLLRNGFRRLLLLNGHGGNIDPMRVALRRLQTPFPSALLLAASYWSIAAAEIAAQMEGPCKTVGHACEAETSLIMHLRPELVKTEAIRNEPDYLPDDVEGAFLCRDMHQRTSQGHTGFPKLGSPEKGARLFEAIVERVTQAANRFLNEPLPT
ncbi:MAG: creatininase family protein [Planctomycetales bacterium]|nr:creatininase family protein [Planctomycetales bacterium]